MLDLHAAYDGTGSTSLADAATIAVGGDGAVVKGVPIISAPRVATLIAWGAIAVAVADGPKELKLQSNDLNDPANGSDWKPGGTSLTFMTPHLMESLPFVSAARKISYAQKATAGITPFWLDHYEPRDARAQCVLGSKLPPNRGVYSQAFGGALTAGAWGTVAFAPASNLPAGRYALLGFWASALTLGALFRFQHADFGVCQPGCAAVDLFTTAATLTGLSGDEIALSPGYQFVAFGEITGKPQCPVFRAGPNGSGLTIWCCDCTADTPTVVLNLAYIGP